MQPQTELLKICYVYSKTYSLHHSPIRKVSLIFDSQSQQLCMIISLGTQSSMKERKMLENVHLMDIVSCYKLKKKSIFIYYDVCQPQYHCEVNNWVLEQQNISTVWIQFQECPHFPFVLSFKRKISKKKLYQISSIFRFRWSLIRVKCKRHSVEVTSVNTRNST